MKLTNLQIHSMAQNYLSAFEKTNNLYLPAKVNFYIQRNMGKIITLAQEIEKARLDIINHYGEPTEEDNNQVHIAAENVNIVNQELLDLFTIEQEVDIITFSIQNFSDDINLSIEQMNTIMFMIED